MSVYAEPARQLVGEIVVRDSGRAQAFYETLGFDLVEDQGDFVSLAWEGCQLLPRDVPAAPEGSGETA